MMETPIKPVDPGPCSTEAERSQFAQDNAKWSAWIAEHPEQASTASPLPEAVGVTVPPQPPAGPSHHKFDPDTGLPVT